MFYFQDIEILKMFLIIQFKERRHLLRTPGNIVIFRRHLQNILRHFK